MLTSPSVSSAGNYAYLDSGLGFASAGVRAESGFAIERGVFADPPDIATGLAAVEAHLRALRRPAQALCGLELRMPSVLSRSAFHEFNTTYLAQLADMGVLDEGRVPLTRTNVVPRGEGAAGSRLSAFSYTVPADGARPTFVLSGVPELPESYTYPDDIVRRGETTADAMAEKARSIVGRLLSYARLLGVAWDSSATVHVYSWHGGVEAVVRKALAPAGVAPSGGVVWHDAAPPIEELDLEIDVRRYLAEVAVAV